MKSTQEVLDHHLQAFGEGLESILSDYDENSTVLSQQGSFKGMAEITEFFTAFVQSLPEGFMDKFNITNSAVDGEVAYITWDALPWFPLGTDTFIIRDGKILYQTFAAHAAGWLLILKRGDVFDSNQTQLSYPQRCRC